VSAPYVVHKIDLGGSAGRTTAATTPEALRRPFEYMAGQRLTNCEGVRQIVNDKASMTALKRLRRHFLRYLNLDRRCSR
jgi:hypothetical protein